MLLNQRRVIVVGGNGLLGREFVQAINDNGGTAIILDKNIQKNISSQNVEYEIDITVEPDVLKLFRILQKESPPIDALVNASYPKNKFFGCDLYDITYSSFSENLAINLGSAFILNREAAKLFVPQKKGHIINISSVYGQLIPDFEIYSGTKMSMPIEYAAIKSGLNHLTRYMAKFLKGTGVRVNSLSPGGVFDNQPEIFLNNYKSKCLNKGMLDPEDLSGTLIYMLSDLSKYLNGQNITVDDGYSL